VSGKHPSQHPRRSSLRPNCLIASTSVDALAIDLCRVEAKVTHICNGKSAKVRETYAASRLQSRDSRVQDFLNPGTGGFWKWQCLL
jgi:hypothetical protein